MQHGLRFNQIAKNLRRKLNDWIASIDNEALQEAIRRDVIVTGGAIATMALGEGVNDYDVYFRTMSTTREVALYYTKKFKVPESNVNKLTPQLRHTTIVNLKGEEEKRLIFWIQSAGVTAEAATPYAYFESRPEFEQDEYVKSLFPEDGEEERVRPGEATERDPMAMIPSVRSAKDGDYSPLFFTNNAVTLSGGIQVVIRFFGEPAEIHTNYDFAHCMAHYSYRDNELVVPPETMECLLSRTLVYKGSLYPICTVLRLRKFLARGWRIHAGEILKICANVAQVDYTDVDQMYDQLLGVDMAYMLDFISALRTAQKTGQKIDGVYLMAMLDEIHD